MVNSLFPPKFPGIVCKIMIRNSNDGTQDSPYLRIDINRGNLWELPDWSVGPQLEDLDCLVRLKSDGFQGVQGWSVAEARKAGLGATASGRVDKPEEAEPQTVKWKEEGFDLATLHVGTGMEDDDEIDRIVSAIIEASEKHDFPVYLETHRATITQDMWRTVQIVKRHPEVRFNGDFSHFYTGQEMVYGDWNAKLDFLQPVFERTCFIHGRIGNPSNMQIRWNDPSMPGSLKHFEDMWTRVFRAWKANAKPGDFFSFTTEIIPFSIHYARQFEMPDGTLREESDRYADAIKMADFARECWEKC